MATGDSREFISFFYLIKKQCKGLPWIRQTRLRVTEHLLGMPYCSITSSKQADEKGMFDVLKVAYPKYAIEGELPPETTNKQIRALCEYYSDKMVEELGVPPTEAVQA